MRVMWKQWIVDQSVINHQSNGNDFAKQATCMRMAGILNLIVLVLLEVMKLTRAPRAAGSRIRPGIRILVLREET